VDFSYEVSRAMAACEGAILLVDASQGVEAQTLAHAHLAQSLGLAIIPVMNKIDLEHSNPDATEEQIWEVLRNPVDTSRISAKDGRGVREVLERVIKEIPAPAGTALKLCMNLIVAQLTTALAESCSLALKTGIRPEHVFETFYNSPALNCGYFRMKEKNILDLEFSPAFSLKNILKDVRFMLEAAKEKNLKLPVTEAVEKTLNEGFKRGYWDEDLTAIMKLYK